MLYEFQWSRLSSAFRAAFQGSREKNQSQKRFVDILMLALQITESDAVDTVEGVLRDSRVTPTTVAFSLTALLKLSSRFPHCKE